MIFLTQSTDIKILLEQPDPRNVSKDLRGYTHYCKDATEVTLFKLILNERETQSVYKNLWFATLVHSSTTRSAMFFIYFVSDGVVDTLQ